MAGLLAEGPGGEYGIHSEMFTTGLMHLHKAGKVTNKHKGIFEGISVSTFAMGTSELYDWLDGQEAVRFLPVEWINTPSIIARNRNMVSINGALMLDLAGAGNQYLENNCDENCDCQETASDPKRDHGFGAIEKLLVGLPNEEPAFAGDIDDRFDFQFRGLQGFAE